MSKDKALGTLILTICILFFYDPYIQPWLNLGTAANVQYWLIALPVFLAFVAILLVGAWIGYTMATTPPPKPVEDIITETDADNTQKK
jgi:hypothetical protein